MSVPGSIDTDPPRRLGDAPFGLGEWTVRPRRHQIEGEAGTRRLSAKAMALLLHFARHPDRVLGKEELIAAAWEGAYTSDEALSTVIYELRRVLGDRASHPRYLETIRKSGYRLLVTPIPFDPASSPTDEEESESFSPSGAPPLESTPTSADAGRRRGRFAVPLLGLTLAILLTVAWWARRTPPSAEGPGQIESLAVLPLSTYLTDNRQLLDTALTDMLVGDIAQACAIDVTPGLILEGDAASWGVDEALASLGVDAVVEGAVARSGNNLWITLQLVDLRTERMLWSATYDRQLGDELLVLREVTQDAALRIRDELGRRAKVANPLEHQGSEASQFIPQVSPE